MNFLPFKFCLKLLFSLIFLIVIIVYFNWTSILHMTMLDTPSQKNNNTRGIEINNKSMGNKNYAETEIRPRLESMPYDVDPEVTKVLYKIISKLSEKKNKTQGTSEDTLNFFAHIHDKILAPAWQKVINNMPMSKLYSEDDPAVNQLLYTMRYTPILNVIQLKGGSEFKFDFTLEDGTPVVGKPQRLPVGLDAPVGMYKNLFLERFQSEVVSFHLNRILGFNHVPPAVSRYTNLTELWHSSTDRTLLDTFYTTSDGLTCVTGHCEKNCDRNHSICGKPDVIAVSMAFKIPRDIMDKNLWLNPPHLINIHSHTHPRYCDKCRNFTNEQSNTTRHALNIIDIAIFDFIQGNLDRHSFKYIRTVVPYSNFILYDNGRALVRAIQDDLPLIWILSECCEGIKLSTLRNLLSVITSKKRLSGALREALYDEIVQPLITEPHLVAIDRRLNRVVEIIYECALRRIDNIDQFIIDDSNGNIV